MANVFFLDDGCFKMTIALLGLRLLTTVVVQKWLCGGPEY